MSSHSTRTAVDLLANGFARLPSIIERATTDLDAQRLASRPAPGTNSIAWLAWHTARGQDAWVGGLDSASGSAADVWIT